MSADFPTTNYSENCLQFARDVAQTIFVIKVVLSSFGMLVSLFVIILIGFMKTYKQFVYRLVVYLMAINTLLSLFQVLELIPIQVNDEDLIVVRNGEGWQKACVIIGYVDTAIVWMGNLLIVWTMLYMLSQSWQLHRFSLVQSSSRGPIAHSRAKIYEIGGILFIIVGSFLVTWIPLLFDMYGPSGLMCWIKTASDDGCTDIQLQNLSATLMMVMFYCPLIVIVVFGLVCMISIIMLLHRASKRMHGGIRQRYQSCMKEIGMLLAYPLIYCLFCFIMLVTRIYSFIHANTEERSPYYPLWIVHAVADPSRMLVPGLAFLLHPYIWRNILSCLSPSEDGKSVYTKYSVPPEDSDIDHGITIRPTREEYYGSCSSASLLFKDSKQL